MNKGTIKSVKAYFNNSKGELLRAIFIDEYDNVVERYYNCIEDVQDDYSTCKSFKFYF